MNHAALSVKLRQAQQFSDKQAFSKAHVPASGLKHSIRAISSLSSFASQPMIRAASGNLSRSESESAIFTAIGAETDEIASISINSQANDTQFASCTKRRSASKSVPASKKPKLGLVRAESPKAATMGTPAAGSDEDEMLLHFTPPNDGSLSPRSPILSSRGEQAATTPQQQPSSSAPTSIECPASSTCKVRLHLSHQAAAGEHLRRKHTHQRIDSAVFTASFPALVWCEARRNYYINRKLLRSGEAEATVVTAADLFAAAARRDQENARLAHSEVATERRLIEQEQQDQQESLLHSLSVGGGESGEIDATATQARLSSLARSQEQLRLRQESIDATLSRSQTLILDSQQSPPHSPLSGSFSPDTDRQGLASPSPPRSQTVGPLLSQNTDQQQVGNGVAAFVGSAQVAQRGPLPDALKLLAHKHRLLTDIDRCAHKQWARVVKPYLARLLQAIQRDDVAAINDSIEALLAIPKHYLRLKQRCSFPPTKSGAKDYISYLKKALINHENMPDLIPEEEEARRDVDQLESEEERQKRFNARRANYLASHGRHGKAVQALERQPAADTSDAAVLEQLGKLTPVFEESIPKKPANAPRVLQLDNNTFWGALRRVCNNSAPCIWGWSPELIKAASRYITITYNKLKTKQNAFMNL